VLLKKVNMFTMKMDKKLMNKTRKYFIGHVVIQDISSVIGSKEQKMYHVTFKKGSKTKLHYHEAGQVLIPTGGKGLLVLYKNAKKSENELQIKKVAQTSLSKGDSVYIPAKILHWHGAVGMSTFSHIAINATLPGYKQAKTVWYESDFVSSARKIK
jgi:quercetin dioxygenase-like cupin family protein